MKGIWKDGLNLFRRDNNVSWRGAWGRDPGNTGMYGWVEGVSGAGRAYIRRWVSKGARRNAKREIGLQADASEAERAERGTNHGEVKQRQAQGQGQASP